MNISSAIKGLQNGRAARPTTWRGYVERIDKTPDAQYSDTETYNVGDKVTRSGARYVCTTAVDVPGPFNLSYWARIDNDRYIVFVDAKDSGETVSTPNPSAIYEGTVTDDGGLIRWRRLGPSDTIPSEVTAVHDEWTGSCPTPVDMFDAEAFSAMLSDYWETGYASDFEAQRVGSSGRW